MKRVRAIAILLVCLVAATSAAIQEATPEQLFEQGKKQFDAFQYDQAVPLFDKLIAALTAGGPGVPVQKPELLIQAYEHRARARFALGDSAGADQDFAELLGLKPDFALAAGVSPRLIKVLDNVRRVTIGRLSVQVTPPGPVTIDGKVYQVTAEPLVFDIKAGEHTVNATRPNYTPFEQKVTVIATEVATMAITLERVAATITVVTMPDDVEVFIDDVSKGRTTKGAAEGVSAPLPITGISLGDHRLKLKRACFVDFDMPFTLVSDDIQPEPVQLTPAVAKVVIESTDREATVVVDGEPRGPVGSDVTVCAGTHLIEVRGARGRFVDRREWKTGDTATLTATLRSAVPFISMQAGAGSTPEQLRGTLERMLAPANRVMFFTPDAAELDAAMKQENIPADWLGPMLGQPGARLPREAVRDMARRLSTRLGVQGLSAAVVGADAYTVSLLFLAAGSGEPDLLTLSLTDSASQGRVLERLNAALPTLVRLSVNAAFIDVAGTPGAVVARAGEGAGLAPGDIITSAVGKPVASVADFQAALAAQPLTAQSIALEVKGAGGVVRKVPAPVTLGVDTLGVRDPALLANRALLDLQDAVRSPVVGVQSMAASINLALVHMRLGNWDDALAAIKDVQLLDGPGVSAGTVAYLNGLAYEALGRAPDATAAFTKAAASPQARLWYEGPLVAPLARTKLQNRR
ncbi:MAG: PEGA domain-containing protein [Acidobacteria bacterium]|nr:PEGA domain-containing protein [Acidobacteriota bacterium]